MQEILIKLGNYIKKNRNLKNITLMQIEKEFGFDNSNWSKIENAKIKSLPKPETLRKIASILEIDILELYLICDYLTTEEINEHIKNRENV